MKTYFRSNTIYKQSPSSIDREKGIIKDIILCQTGEAKGHDLFINDQFIDKVVQLGNDNQVGIKARFGHPNICSTALGSYLGRYKNFRSDGNKAIADLYLDSTSKKSPNGLRAQAQGLIFLVTFGAGLLAGNFINGKLIEHYSVDVSGTLSYDWNAIWGVTSISSIILLLIFLLLFRDKKLQ